MVNSNQNQNNMVNMSKQSNIQWVGSMAHGAAIAGRKNVEILESKEFPQYGVRIEILGTKKFEGISGAQASDLYFRNQHGVSYKQVVLYILNSAVKTEAGAMSYLQGPLEMVTGIDGAGKAAKQFITGKLTGERMAMPEYTGSGVLVLEPSYKHFAIVELRQGESIICDKGLFFAASKSVNVSPVMAGKVSGAVLGGEGFFQQQITGPGFVVLKLPVPESEISKVRLNNDVIKVDGNFAVLRSAGIQMTTERSSKTLVGSAVSGEGLLNVYRGTGDVWLAPLMRLYGYNDNSSR